MDPYANIYGSQIETPGAPYQGTNGQWYDADGNPIAMPQAPTSAPTAPQGAFIPSPGTPTTPISIGGQTPIGASASGGWMFPEQKADTTSPPEPPDTTKGPLAPFSEAAPNFPSEPAFSFGEFKPPSIADALASPGLQFRMQMGTDALNRAAAARGTLNDSGTLKSMIDYGQNVGEQGYADAYNRDFQGWNANRDLAAQTYGMNRTSQFLDPYQAAFSAWRARAGDYLQNQGTVANTAINWANL